MRFKVELHDALLRELRNLWPPWLIDVFYERLHEVVQDPIARSKAHYDPALSRYMLRRFFFGERPARIAIFKLDLAGCRMRVLTCRVLGKRDALPRGPDERPGANGDR